MHRTFIRFAALAACAALTFAVPEPGSAAHQNPLMSPSTLPFGAPQFDRITDADYQPAIEAGIAQQEREIDAIANNPAPPTFENTFVAMERSGQTLQRALLTFSAVSEADTDPQLQRVREAIAPELAAHQDAIHLNAKLFARVKNIYARLGSLHLDPESEQLVRVDYREFVHDGADLPGAKQAQLRVINRRLALLQAAFSRKLLAATAAGALTVDGRTIALQNTTQQPALASMSNRTDREHLFLNSWYRAEKGDANDTRSTIAEMAQLRAQKAALFGYPDYAAYALTMEMAKTPSAVQHFLHGLIGPTRVKAREEADAIQAQIDKDGGGFTLKPWDWDYYAEQVRKAKYDLNEDEIRPYFELNNVLHNGLFYAANQLYGITFKERHDIPVYQPDVRVFEVYDKDGSPLALMYFDFFKRDNKQGGAWMAQFVRESKLLGTKPVVYNVENIPKPPAGQPVLLTPGEVSGIFHEFGHALNGFFSVQKYPSLSGTASARDFVEFPSQFNEHWAMYPSVLKHYAYDYRTHQPMPQELIDKVERAAQFNQGYALGEALAADELDMAWHSLPASAPKQNVDTFEAQALKSSGTNFYDVPPRYRSSYFSHIWASGYAAGYYAYAWSEMLDDDAYQWFVEHGGLTRSNGQRFRDLILSRGDSEDLGAMFRAFYGKDPDVAPLLKDRGLTSP
jgi:peptidyl-dipeptidase Dcp